ncbi:MAG: AAA family ATPase [Actinomycetales bacterium]|nr:AAA family ATPase [Actinomycetales bacterium]
MSGTGKSAVLRELGQRSYEVVDTDDGLAHEIVSADGRTREQVWDVAAMDELLGLPRHAALVVSGCASNQGAFYDRFDAVLLLSAPAEVLLARIDARAKGFGKSAEDRARVLADLAEVEPLLRATCTAEVRTDRPLTDVVADVSAIIAGLPSALHQPS